MKIKSAKPKSSYKLVDWRDSELLVNISQYEKRSRDGFLVDVYQARVLGWVVSSSEIPQGENFPAGISYTPVLIKDQKGCRSFLRGRINYLDKISF